VAVAPVFREERASGLAPAGYGGSWLAGGCGCAGVAVQRGGRGGRSCRRRQSARRRPVGFTGLVALAEAVDPAQALDEPFSATDAIAQPPGGGLDRAIARMRFSGLAQVVQTHFHEAKSFEVGGDRGGIITYCRRLAGKRGIGWLRRRTTAELARPLMQQLAGRGHRAAVLWAAQLRWPNVARASRRTWRRPASYMAANHPASEVRRRLPVGRPLFTPNRPHAATWECL
jgi:hypothetical protein